MKVKLDFLSASETVAIGVKLCGVKSVVNYPLPLSSDVNNKIMGLIKSGYLCDFNDANSMNAAFNMAIASTLMGKRTFLATSVIDALDDFYNVAFQRLPMIVVNVSKSLGASTISQDHSSLILRDSGWIIFSPATNQEIVDMMIYGYKISETPKISLPVMIQLDALMDFSEPLVMPGDKIISNFLGNPKPRINVKKPESVNSYIEREDYVNIKKQQREGMANVNNIIKKIDEMWKKKFKREVGLVENYKTEDADIIIVITGYHSLTAKAAVDKLRSQGKKAGLVRLKLIRPLPKDDIKKYLEKAAQVIVIDQAFSGNEGIMYNEIKSVFSGKTSNVVSIGKHLAEKDIISAVDAKDEVTWI